MSRRGYNAIYLPWSGFSFPNNLSPIRGEPELTFEQFAANLQAAGVNSVRVKLSGWNGPMGTGAQSFEPHYGQYNDWGGRLGEMVDALWAHDIGMQVMPFCNVEFQAGWAAHGWNTRNGGLLDDPRDVFTDGQAIDAAKSRIDAIVARCGDVIDAWELCAEMSFLVTPAFWSANNWAEMQHIVRGILVPWVETMAAHIKGVHSAPVGNGQIFAPSGIDSNPNHPSSLRNEVYRADGLDFALVNWYGDQSVSDKLRWLRECQAYAGIPVYVEQYAPWDTGQNAPYTREPPDYSWSKAHEWAAVCGEYGAVGPYRWPEIRPSDDYNAWWGIASPEMAEIAGVTRQFGESIDLDDWTGTGAAWEAWIVSDGLDWRAAWGDGQHVAAFLTWSTSGSHTVTVGGMDDLEYEVRFYDWINGDQVARWKAMAVDGILTLPGVPHRDSRAVFYIERVKPPPVLEARTMRVEMTEMRGSSVVSVWRGELTEAK